MGLQIVKDFKRWIIDKIEYEQRGVILRIRYQWTNGQQNTLWTKRNNIKSKKSIDISRYKESSGISNKLGETSTWAKRNKRQGIHKEINCLEKRQIIEKRNKNERHYGQDCTEIDNDNWSKDITRCKDRWPRIKECAVDKLTWMKGSKKEVALGAKDQWTMNKKIHCAQVKQY